MSSLGAGLLVGTALAVIIPEGVAILISNPAYKSVPLEEVEEGIDFFKKLLIKKYISNIF